MRRKCDFTEKTKDILAKRSSYKCNNPECRKLIVFANSDPEKFILTGEACHIEAASPRGARYNPNMTTQERIDISNGIWLCNTCAKLIDRDTEKYTTEVLKQWKSKAEENPFSHPESFCVPPNPQIVSVTNVEGGVGKSATTALLARAIAEACEKKVLCISVHPIDDVMCYYEENPAKWSAFNPDCSWNLISYSLDIVKKKIKEDVHSYDCGVDVVPYRILVQLACYYYYHGHEYSIDKIISMITLTHNYEIILCDCGRGDSVLQKSIVQQSNDIIIPVGDRVQAASTVKYMDQLLQKTDLNKSVYFVMSKGYNKCFYENWKKETNILKNEFTKVCIFDTPIPISENIMMGNCHEKNYIKNVMAAYTKLGRKILFK